MVKRYKPMGNKRSSYKPKFVRATEKQPEVNAAHKQTYKSVPLTAADATGAAGAKRVRDRYTGTYVQGIGTMHKSNLVPITEDSDAVDIARMRR